MTRETPENIRIEYSNEEKNLINSTLLKGCSDLEKLEVWHLANKYGLDLMQRGQIWVTPGYNGNQHTIIVGRDGQLTIAHRQGLKSLRTTCEYSPEDRERAHPLSATCIVERFDGGHFEATATMHDYDTHKALWLVKPSEMIGKVAESKVLRRAFDMSGFYSPEEVEEIIEKPLGISKNYNEFDLSKPGLTEEKMNRMEEDIRNDFIGQEVTKEERDACRRSDGLYDMEAATVLKKAKHTAYLESGKGVV